MVANAGGEIVQWNADRMRALKAGIRNHDDEGVAAVLGQIAEKFGEEFADGIFVQTVSRMIDDENFSFVEIDSSPDA